MFVGALKSLDKVIPNYLRNIDSKNTRVAILTDNSEDL